MDSIQFPVGRGFRDRASQCLRYCGWKQFCGGRFKTLRFPRFPGIGVLVNRLTKQEQLVLGIVIGLLVLGWSVKFYRTAHPATVPVRSQK